MIHCHSDLTQHIFALYNSNEIQLLSIYFYRNTDFAQSQLYFSHFVKQYYLF